MVMAVFGQSHIVTLVATPSTVHTGTLKPLQSQQQSIFGPNLAGIQSEDKKRDGHTQFNRMIEVITNSVDIIYT